jgi:cell wall-associated NlpC family hydrolase
MAAALIDTILEEDVELPDSVVQQLRNKWVSQHKVKGNLRKFRLEIEKWLGTPYRYGGSTRQVGTDCSGYVRSLMKAVWGLDLPRSGSEMFAIGDSVSRDSLQIGDLVFFSYRKRGISHVGVYIGNGLFTHSSSRFGVQNYILDDPYYWKKRYRGARRY